MSTGNRRGLTLLELTISLALTGMMALIGFSAFSGVIDRRRTVVEATMATERAASLRTLLHGWLLPAQIQAQSGGTPRRRRTRRCHDPADAGVEHSGRDPRGHQWR
ncbi:MAG: prepilin-type N-terminal cleavage/methylation domain-containing protein [Gemmatimonadetes bacterium]|nr:prepilin-type N-terminal cleavage/methylation domain-containing protein [Gemmatimonadota bacterium]